MVLSGPTQNLLEVKGKITLARSWHHKFIHFITDTCCLCIFAYYCIQTNMLHHFKVLAVSVKQKSLCTKKANLRDLVAAIGLVISNGIQIDFSSRVTQKFDRRHREKGEHLLWYQNYKCHFVAIHEFKLELLSGNTQTGAKSSILQPLWP